MNLKLIGIALVGVLLGNFGPANAQAPSSPASEPRDELVSQHGALRLLLTGTCGHEGNGREAVLSFGSDVPKSIGVKVETSVWDGGWFRSSSVQHHTLGGFEEKRLGCTHRSSDIEHRYAIAKVSNTASQAVRLRGRQRSPRSQVKIASAGTCGRNRHGRWRSIVNAHPHQSVAVSVRYLESADGTVRRRYEKTHHLQPGATVRLGCSRDGSSTRRFTILGARYRSPTPP